MDPNGCDCDQNLLVKPSVEENHEERNSRSMFKGCSGNYFITLSEKIMFEIQEKVFLIGGN